MPARMLRLLSLLQSRREWSGAELSERLGVTDRTVRRDVDRLRELGYPVSGTTGTAGGYRLTSGRDLPPLVLDDDEAVAVAIGLRTAADGAGADVGEAAVRALAKLGQVLPARLRHRVAGVGDVTVATPRAEGAAVDPTVLAVLAGACRDHELVAFGYRRRDGVASSRRVEAYRLVTSHGFWYLVAFDVQRGDWRTFRVDRVDDPVPTRHRFPPRELPDADVAEFVRRAIMAAPARYRVVATVAAPADVVLAGVPRLLRTRVTAIDAGSCTVALASDSLDALVGDLAAVGAPFLLDAPADVRSHLRERGRQLIAAADQ
ncbi:helix-turn-helix transcriptional regulator [Pseudonocardia sp. GCM10023141]|uniref:helix-turn-helix transcriptional regulator n=1 Tax=Pseudonocardia sp. GCM10023141 TaxID=3252653 RepID=UPI003606F9B4